MWHPPLHPPTSSQRWHWTFWSGSWVQADGRVAFAWPVQMTFNVFCEVMATEVATLICFDAGFYSIRFQGLSQNFREEHLMKWSGTIGTGDALSFDKGSRMPKWKQNICVFLFVLASLLVVRLNKKFHEKKKKPNQKPDLEEIYLKAKYTCLTWCALGKQVTVSVVETWYHINYFLVVVLFLVHLIYLIGVTGKLFSCLCDSNAMSIIMYFDLTVMGI